MKRIIASIAAAGILVVGAFAASAITSSEVSAQTDEAPVVTDEIRRSNPGAILDQVLGDLVEDGTLEQSQSDAVKNGLEAKRDELKERFGDLKDRRGHRQEIRESIEAWLEDGVITTDELAELEVELPIHEDGPLAEALEDGQITQAEWDAFLAERKANHEAHRGAAPDSVTG
jgi:Arc/MetJ-type ribon-helix-helix transcriptional regulator